MGNPSLTRFFTAFRLELRLLVFSWVYPLLHLGWLVLLLALFLGKEDRSAQALLETTLGRLSIGMASLMALFVAGIGATRPIRTKSFELEEALPTGIELPFARWLAGCLALLPFLVEPIVIAATQGPMASLITGLPLFLMEAALTVAFTCAAACWLVSWLRLGRWVYPLLATGWLGFLLGPVMIAENVPWFTLFNFMRQGVSYYYELWGRLIYGRLWMWFNLFYFGLLLLFLGFLAVQFRMRRFYRLSLTGLALMVVAFAFTGFGAGRYISTVNTAEQKATQESSAWGEAYSAAASQPAIIVEAYDLVLDLADWESQRFAAQLTVRNPDEAPINHLAFTLEPGLEISKASLPFERQGALLSFALPQPLPPGETLALTLEYSGHIWKTDWMDGLPVASDFTYPHNIRLSSQTHWYPRSITDLGDPLIHLPTRFHLKVTNAGEVTFATNLPMVGNKEFEAKDATWVFLVGSPHLAVEQIGDVTLVVARNDLPRARQLVNVYARPLAELRRFFPDLPIDGLTLMVLSEEAGLPDFTPPSDHQAVIVTSRLRLARLEGKTDAVSLAADLWQLGGVALHPRLHEMNRSEDAIGRVTTILSGNQITPLDYTIQQFSRFFQDYIDYNGDAHSMQTGLTDDSSKIKATLMDIYGRQAEAGIVRVIQAIRQRSEELRLMESYDQVPAWLLDAAGE